MYYAGLDMETFLSVALGLGLAAACGFRLFVPMLVLGVALRTGHVAVGDGFEWLASDAALVTLGLATGLEIAAYYVPWLDNLLDGVATPVAVIAGALVTASVVTEMSPFLRWTLALIAGGGVAGVVQGLTVTTRATSSLSTAGAGNPFVATAEAVGSLLLSLLSLVWPLVALLIVVLLLPLALLALFRLRRTPSRLAGRPPPASAPPH